MQSARDVNIGNTRAAGRGERQHVSAERMMAEVDVRATSHRRRSDAPSTARCITQTHSEIHNERTTIGWMASATLARRRTTTARAHRFCTWQCDAKITTRTHRAPQAVLLAEKKQVHACIKVIGYPMHTGALSAAALFWRTTRAKENAPARQP